MKKNETVFGANKNEENEIVFGKNKKDFKYFQHLNPKLKVLDNQKPSMFDAILYPYLLYGISNEKLKEFEILDAYVTNI